MAVETAVPPESVGCAARLCHHPGGFGEAGSGSLGIWGCVGGTWGRGRTCPQGNEVSSLLPGRLGEDGSACLRLSQAWRGISPPSPAPSPFLLPQGPPPRLGFLGPEGRSGCHPMGRGSGQAASFRAAEAKAPGRAGTQLCAPDLRAPQLGHPLGGVPGPPLQPHQASLGLSCFSSLPGLLLPAVASFPSGSSSYTTREEPACLPCSQQRSVWTLQVVDRFRTPTHWPYRTPGPPGHLSLEAPQSKCVLVTVPYHVSLDLPGAVTD